MKAAFKNLIEENFYLLETAFDKVVGFELADRGAKYFYLKDKRNCSILKK